MKRRARRSTVPPPRSLPDAAMTATRSDVPLADFRVQERVRVRFNEIDGQNIVFNAIISFTRISASQNISARSAKGSPDPIFTNMVQTFARRIVRSTITRPRGSTN